jgi:hypothetical protein
LHQERRIIEEKAWLDFVAISAYIGMGLKFNSFYESIKDNALLWQQINVIISILSLLVAIIAIIL